MLRHKYRHTGNYPQERRDLMFMKQRTAQCNRKKNTNTTNRSKNERKTKKQLYFYAVERKENDGKKNVAAFLLLFGPR